MHRTWAYVLSIILAGALLSGLVLSDLWQPTPQWPAFLLLTALCIGCHFFKARGAGHEAWHANLVALFAGVLLLSPGLFISGVTFLVISGTVAYPEITTSPWAFTYSSPTLAAIEILSLPPSTAIPICFIISAIATAAS